MTVAEVKVMSLPLHESFRSTALPPSPSRPSTREVDTSRAAHSRSPSPITLTPPSPTRSPPRIEYNPLLQQELPILEPNHDSISQTLESAHLPLDIDCGRLSPEVESEHSTGEPESEHSETSMVAPDVNEVRRGLARHNLFYEDGDVLKRGGDDMIRIGQGILAKARGSPTAKENAPYLRDAIKRYCSSTERTMVFNMWKILKGEYRHVLNIPLTPDEETSAQEWVKRAWHKDCLDCELESDFDSKGLPDTSETGSKALNLMFKDFPRITSPRPDVTYGLWIDDVSTELQLIFDKTHCRLAKSIYLPSFIVELKNDQGLPKEAENQTIRGGAAMVNCRHNWNRVVDGKEHWEDMTSNQKMEERQRQKSQAQSKHVTSIQDKQSIAFSLAFHPTVATMHIHWREEWSDGVDFWHAHPIATYTRDLGSIESLGTGINNILDWSCTERRTDIEQQAKQFVKRKYPTMDEKMICFTPNKRQKPSTSDSQ